MKLVIDCFKQVKGTGKSIGIYNVALSLIQNLVIEKQRTKNEEIKNCQLIVLGNEYNREDFDIDGVRFIQIENYNPLNKIQCVCWELWGVSRECKQVGADKVLFPRGYCALTHPIEDIVLIHDLIPFYYHEHFPGVFNKLENAYIMYRLKESAKRANKIITISEASKLEILKYCNVEEQKITVIHNACNAVDFCEEKVEQTSSYLCAMTSGLPHKNAKGVLAGYEEYFKNCNKPLDLVVIGIEDASKYGISDEVVKHIKCHKFLKDNHEMYRVINNSKMFLFLSLVEGFGLPPIEAMQLGVPVICSNLSSLPEVVGDAAILVDPVDKTAVANAIMRLQGDTKLQNSLIEKGKRNIERFSWNTRAELYWKEILRR